MIDRDQGKHLSRIFDFYPPDVLNLTRVDRPSAALRIIDTAPEVNAPIVRSARGSSTVSFVCPLLATIVSSWRRTAV